MTKYWWSLGHDQWMVIASDKRSEWLLASPVGEDARKLALLQCVPESIEVPGVGVRLAIGTFLVKED